MKVRLFSFNIYLAILIAAGMAGCKTASDKKPAEAQAKDKKEKKRKIKTDEIALIRFHFEANPDPSGRTGQISVLRSSPTILTVDKVPEITEANVAGAELLDDNLGGFVMKVTLNHSGTLLLENSTTIHKNQHLAIFCQFGKQKGKTSEIRWLGAPVISQPIRDGTLVFTPDASREECERIVAGVNYMASKMNDDPTKLFQ